jgi:FtsH-binding integral membrane protein
MAVAWKSVARDVGIVFVLTFLGGLVVGFTTSMAGAEVNVVAIALSNIVFGTVGFTISGCIVKSNRFKHLYQVALGVWLLSLINVAFGVVDIQQWLVSILSVLLMMGMGGGLSYLFVRTPKIDQLPSSGRNPSSLE